MRIPTVPLARVRLGLQRRRRLRHVPIQRKMKVWCPLWSLSDPSKPYQKRFRPLKTGGESTAYKPVGFLDGSRRLSLCWGVEATQKR